MNNEKVMLVILDGWGIGPDKNTDAIQQAQTPYMDSLYERFPHAQLTTFGEEVGLPEGQMGNSEVGHLNIGAGRIVYQELARINKAIKEGTMAQNPTLLTAIQHAKEHQKPIHLMGLLSDGGVHSHINHLKGICDIITQHGVSKTYLHMFMDGRDTAPKGGKGYLADVLQHTANQPVEIATVIGRYYAMDRDKRWERIKLAYDLLVHGTGTPTHDLLTTMEERYQGGETDEFIKPIYMADEGGQPIATIQEGEVVICFNFRTDRPRQITTVLTQQAFPEYDMTPLDLHYVTMTRYDETYNGLHVLFEKDKLKQTLGEVLSNAGKTQVRIAETEKYPHVTYFFNGGLEPPFENEERLLVNSPKVATYDLKPEMSALEITDSILQAIHSKKPDFICLNYANADMVGHTGVFEAAIKAAETVDHCVSRLIEAGLKEDYHAIIIADHGNSDFMINADGTPHTAHTKNPVPCIYVSNNATNKTVKNGKLADIAPTILHIMDIPAPESMDGEVLLG